jgi:hypothetical protein
MGDTVVIEPRFNGPADSANGGYMCGLLAAAIDGPAAVSLLRPPPLARELTIARDGERALLLDGEELVADAEPAAVDWDVPSAPSLDDARAAVPKSPFLQDDRPFKTCFVCGNEREHGDGLEIWPGTVDCEGGGWGRGDLHAGTWTPDASLAGDHGSVRPEIVWASLDCPTSGPVGNEPDPDGTLRPIVLARLAADIRGSVEPGREYVVTAWPMAIDGRKRHSGSALFTAEGDLLATARALWIELKETGPAAAR